MDIFDDWNWCEECGHPIDICDCWLGMSLEQAIQETNKEIKKAFAPPPSTKDER